MTFQERAEQLAAEMTLEERALMLCFDSPPVKRLGIPAYPHCDGKSRNRVRSVCSHLTISLLAPFVIFFGFYY